jgi:hypothetical protein
MSGENIHITCPSCYHQNLLLNQSTKGVYKCSHCQSQFSDFISLILLTQFALKSVKIVGLSVLVSISLLTYCIRSVLAGTQSPHISSAPATSQPQKIPNPPSIIPINRSLPSNPILISQTMNGGALTVSSGTGRDAYVKLIEPNSRTLMAAFFVKSNSSFMQEQIPDGTYKVLFVLGNGWNAQTQAFTKNKSFAKFDKLLNFTTMQVSGGIQYKVFKITLHPVTGGKARTSGVSQREFESY